MAGACRLSSKYVWFPAKVSPQVLVIFTFMSRYQSSLLAVISFRYTPLTGMASSPGSRPATLASNMRVCTRAASSSSCCIHSLKWLSAEESRIALSTPDSDDPSMPENTLVMISLDALLVYAFCSSKSGCWEYSSSRKNLTVFVPSSTLPSDSFTEPVAPMSDCRNTGSRASTPETSAFS